MDEITNPDCASHRFGQSFIGDLTNGEICSGALIKKRSKFGVVITCCEEGWFFVGKLSYKLAHDPEFLEL